MNGITNVCDVLLKYYGFAPTDIALLQDKRAAKDAVLAALKRPVASSGRGPLVSHYSGRGSQIRDAHGDELSDGLDEILCPYDLDWAGAFFGDDDVAGILGEMKEGVSAEIILDSCHEAGRRGEAAAAREGCRLTCLGCRPYPATSGTRGLRRGVWFLLVPSRMPRRPSRSGGPAGAEPGMIARADAGFGAWDGQQVTVGVLGHVRLVEVDCAAYLR